MEKTGKVVKNKGLKNKDFSKLPNPTSSKNITKIKSELSDNSENRIILVREKIKLLY